MGLMGTYSSVTMLSPRRRTEALAEARDFVEAQNLYGSDGRIPVPMACRCWKTLRI